MRDRDTSGGTERAIPLLPISLLPLAIGAFYVLHQWIQASVSPFAVLRALVVAIVAPLAIWVLASVALRDRGKGTVAAVLVMLAVLIGPNLPLPVADAVLLGLTLVGPALLAMRSGRVAIPWARATVAGNRLALILGVALAISAFQTGGTIAQLPRDLADELHLGSTGNAAAQASSAAAPDLPDIYMVVLEDHPRADMLERFFGVDSSAFNAGLEELGFHVAPRSRSNYSTTHLSLLTMLEMRHVEDIPELAGVLRGNCCRQPLIRDLTNSARSLEALRDHGYEIVAVSAGFEEVALRGADRFLDGGEINELEMHLLSESAIGPLIEAVRPSFYAEQQRIRTLSAFDYLAELARERVDHPRFVFVHVLAPHGPIVFGVNNEMATPSLMNLYDYDRTGGWQALRQRYAEQVRRTDELSLQAMRDLDQHARSPYVAIIMGEEGTKLFIEPEAGADRSLDEAVSIIFAARVPGGEDLFGPMITPVNLFPILFERYLGVSFPRQSDRTLVSDPEDPFEFTEIPNADAPSP